MPAEQQSNIYINGEWRQLDEVFVYIGGAWRRVNQAYVQHSGVWRRYYAYDATAPTVQSFALSGLVAGNTYGPSQTTATYILTFSEPVTGLTTSDISFIGTSTTWSVTSITNPSLDQKTYTVSASATSLTAGTVRFRLANNSVSDIVDGNAFNLYTAGTYDSESFNIDLTKPTVDSFATSSSQTSRTVSYTITFSKDVTGVTFDDITISGTSTGWKKSTLTGSGKNYTATFVENTLGSTIDGSLTLTFAANGATDLFGNTGPNTNATSSAFTVVRKPPTPSITSITSVNTTLHDRRIDIIASMPSSLTNIDQVIAHYYDANDNYIANSSIYRDISPTKTNAFTENFSKNMGRNPATKYFVRVQTRNTDGLYSDTSARSEITTGADQTPPVVAKPTVTVNNLAKVAYPGRTTTSRLLTVDWSYSGLTDEVEKITVYLGTLTHEVTKPAGGWGTLTTGSKQFTGLTANTLYTAYVRSTDIYGGTNSTADSLSASATTQAMQSEPRVNYTLTYDNNYSSQGWGSDAAYADPGGSIVGTPGYANDGDPGGTVWCSAQGVLGTYDATTTTWNQWTGWFSGVPIFSDGALLDGVYLTAITIRTPKAHSNNRLGVFTNFNNDYIFGTVKDPISNTSVIAFFNTTDFTSTTTIWTGAIQLASPSNSGYSGIQDAGFRIRLCMRSISYNGVQGITNSNLRIGIWEVNYTAEVRRYTPAYEW